jgi:hypothetical protein
LQIGHLKLHNILATTTTSRFIIFLQVSPKFNNKSHKLHRGAPSLKRAFVKSF